VKEKPAKKAKRGGKVILEEDEDGEPVKYTSEIDVCKGAVRDMSAPMRNFDRAPYHIGDNRYYMQVGNVNLTSSDGNKFKVESLIQTRKPLPGAKGKPFDYSIPLRFIDQTFYSLGEILGYDMKTFKADPRREERKTKN
jgi:hypothetical protein